MEIINQKKNLRKSKARNLPKREQLDYSKLEAVKPSFLWTKKPVDPLSKTELNDNDFPKTETTKPHDDSSTVDTADPFDKVELEFLNTVKPFLQPQSAPKFSSRETTSFNRIRDFISLLLTYPMRTRHYRKLKVWAQEASNGYHLIAEGFRLLHEKPLRYVEGLVPMKILEDIENGTGSCVFGDKNIHVIPEAILNLAADLAVHQLIHTLLSGDDHVLNIHHIMLFTRTADEKRAVLEKIEAALNEENNMLRLNETFSGVLIIDASMYHSQVKAHVRRSLAQQFQLPVSKGDKLEDNDKWLMMKRIEKEMSRKKYLVILVDGNNADKPLDPLKVGFPKEKLAGVVVLITNKSSKPVSDELTMAMDLRIRTEDHVLPWELFCQNVGSDFVRSCDAIQRSAVSIVEECGGHLLAILLVARSLKNLKDVQFWKHALDRLRYPNPAYDMSLFCGVSTVMVNAFTNFIWEVITKEKKHCLIRCLSIPGIYEGKTDYEVIGDWLSYVLVDVEEALGSLRQLVDHSVFLQFESSNGRCIFLPEDTCAILQSLNTTNHFLIRKDWMGLIEPPIDRLRHDVLHVELANIKLSKLPVAPICPELQVLVLQGNAELTRIPPFFFIQMPLLNFLDLSYTSVRELPNSFFQLQQLRKLYMKGCECFMKLPPEIGRLRGLEEINLDGTQIIHLPREIQVLTNLKRLTLCFYEYRGKKNRQYTQSTIIPSEVISKLIWLEHLSVEVYPDDERWLENVPIILPEILGLKCLRSIALYIPQLELLQHIAIRIFQFDFGFIVGRHTSRIISGTPPTAEAKFKQSNCSLKLVKAVDVRNEFKRIVRFSKALFLDRHMTIKSLSEFGSVNLNQLQVCILAECKEMQTIIDACGRYSSNMDMLSHLLLLSVSYMKNLRSIWEGPFPSNNCFGMLKSLALYNCPQLRTIFTLDFLGNLSLLKELTVKDCPKISTLVSHTSSKPIPRTFLPKLRKMSLLHLPALITISKGLLIGPSLEKLEIYDCPKLKHLSKKELISETLKVIKGETQWWEALKWIEAEWGKPGPPSQFDHIFSSINTQIDIMTQLGTDDDIDEDPGLRQATCYNL